MALETSSLAMGRSDSGAASRKVAAKDACVSSITTTGKPCHSTTSKVFAAMNWNAGDLSGERRDCLKVIADELDSLLAGAVDAGHIHAFALAEALRGRDSAGIISNLGLCDGAYVETGVVDILVDRLIELNEVPDSLDYDAVIWIQNLISVCARVVVGCKKSRKAFFRSWPDVIRVLRLGMAIALDERSAELPGSMTNAIVAFLDHGVHVFGPAQFDVICEANCVEFLVDAASKPTDGPQPGAKLAVLRQLVINSHCCAKRLFAYPRLETRLSAGRPIAGDTSTFPLSESAVAVASFLQSMYYPNIRDLRQVSWVYNYDALLEALCHRTRGSRVAPIPLSNRGGRAISRAIASTIPQQYCSLPSCGGTPSKLLSCSRCQQAFYCNEECQAAHWRDHKKACRRSTTNGNGKTS